MPTDSPAPPPDKAALHQAALSYLARFAATEAGLRRVLLKRIDRWAQAQPDREAAAPAIAAAKSAIPEIVAAMAQSGAVSDTQYAESRARSLIRSGRSRRTVQAKLVSKGVATDLARAATGEDADSEFAAALVLVRKRRLGLFRTTVPEDPQAARRKDIGVLARAGFARDVVERALDTDPEEAERRIHALRSDQPLAG